MCVDIFVLICYVIYTMIVVLLITYIVSRNGHAGLRIQSLECH